MAWWQGWQPPTVLDEAIIEAAAKLRTCARTTWDKVTGPIAALVATVWRLGWGTLAPDRFVDDLGNVVSFQLDPPAAVHKLAKASVARWQFRMAARHVPACIPDRPDFVCPQDGPVAPVMPGSFMPPTRVTAWLPQSVCGITAPLGRLLESRTGRSRTVPTYTCPSPMGTVGGYGRTMAAGEGVRSLPRRGRHQLPVMPCGGWHPSA